MSTITTAAELDALPAESIVRGPGNRIFVKTHVGDWRMAGRSGYATTDAVAGNLPDLTALYRPDAPSVETYHGRCSEVSFVREGQQPMCSQCSEDEGDPFGDYCCDCCNERGRQPGTYLTVRLDDDPPVHMGRVTVIYQENAS